MIRLFPSGSKKGKDKRDWNNCQCSCKFYGDSFIQSRRTKVVHGIPAAVTEEVSFTAVPAKIPKASPLVWEKPRTVPSIGKNKAASILKKKMTEIDCATSSSSASMTGAVAAIAEPPQIEEPTPMSVEIFPGT